MKIPRPRSDHGSAVIVMLILLFLMVALSVANTRALSNLGKEMQALNQQQMKKFEGATNRVSAPAPKP